MILIRELQKEVGLERWKKFPNTLKRFFRNRDDVPDDEADSIRSFILKMTQAYALDKSDPNRAVEIGRLAAAQTALEFEMRANLSRQIRQRVAQDEADELAFEAEKLESERQAVKARRKLEVEEVERAAERETTANLEEDRRQKEIKLEEQRLRIAQLKEQVKRARLNQKKEMSKAEQLANLLDDLKNG